LNLILAALAILSCVLLVWQWLAARRFPLHAKVVPAGFAPAVSILKPLRGCDDTTAASLGSWLKQDYAGATEILFGVGDAADPVCEIVRRLLAENPASHARLVVCENLVGANGKVAKLARLEKLAAHDLILISDEDVRVAPDFLSQFVAPLRDEATGLVNCFYRVANPATAAMRWEALAVNADFWSQVLQAQTLKPMDFALGAAILVRRPALAAVGGFTPLANCLADDYQLGRRIFQAGHRIALCPMVVECWDVPQGWKQVWKHQVRWARTIRISAPAPYFFSVLANATLWPVLWLSAALAAGTGGYAVPVAGCFLAVRVLMVRDLERRFTPGPKPVSPLWLSPVKDGLQAGLWLTAFLGGTIEWRGRKMTVRRDGTLAEA
jgi:ceramide glucosyltransferase